MRYPDDSQRPLTAAGQDRFRQFVARLSASGLRLDRIATSPFVRCLQTAELLAAGCDPRPPITEHPALATDLDLAVLLDWTRAQRVASVGWVGHAPDMGEFVAQLIGDRRAQVHFSKGAAALLEFADEVATGRGELRWLVTAKILGC